MSEMKTLQEIWETPSNEGSRNFMVGKPVYFRQEDGKVLAIEMTTLAGSMGRLDAYRVICQHAFYIFPATAMAARWAESGAE